MLPDRSGEDGGAKVGAEAPILQGNLEMMNCFARVTVLLFLFSGTGMFAQKPDLTGVEIITHKVRGNIHMLEATGDVAGNMAVSVGSDGILLVDSQFAELGDPILAVVRKLHDGPIKFIVNTHHHEDHSDGNAALGKDATIIGAHNMHTRLSQPEKSGQPYVTFSDEMAIHFNGEEIRLVHLPGGHTDSDVVVFFTGSNVVHLGDLFNAGISSFPNVDLSAGGTISGLVEIIEDLIEMIPEGAVIIPGHYEVSNLDGLRRYHQMIVDTVKFVKRQKEAGRTIKQIQEQGLPDKYSNWGKTGYTSGEQWIENIFRGL